MMGVDVSMSIFKEDETPGNYSVHSYHMSSEKKRDKEKNEDEDRPYE